MRVGAAETLQQPINSIEGMKKMKIKLRDRSRSVFDDEASAALAREPSLVRSSSTEVAWVSVALRPNSGFVLGASTSNVRSSRAAREINCKTTAQSERRLFARRHGPRQSRVLICHFSRNLLTFGDVLSLRFVSDSSLRRSLWS